MEILSLIGWTLTGILTFMFAKGGVEKIIGSKEMVDNFTYMKLEKYRVLTGIGEIIGVILLAIPLTSLYGMVLLTSFMSAAVVMHLSMMGGAKTYVPLLLGMMAVISYVLRTL